LDCLHPIFICYLPLLTILILEIAKALNTAADSLGWDDEEVNRNLKILLDNKMDLDIIAGMEDKTILAFNLAYSLISRVKSNHVKFQTNMMLNPHMAEVLLRQTSLGASQLLNNVNNIVAPSTPPTVSNMRLYVIYTILNVENARAKLDPTRILKTNISSFEHLVWYTYIDGVNIT
jgi:hypothetical protein